MRSDLAGLFQRVAPVACNRSAIGTMVRLEGSTQSRRVRADSSYCSANDLRVLIGLGDDEDEQAVVVDWRGGRRERFANLPTRSLTVLREGTGQPVGNPRRVPLGDLTRETRQ